MGRMNLRSYAFLDKLLAKLDCIEVAFLYFILTLILRNVKTARQRFYGKMIGV
jgi:hypothetical protein